ncbi:hypothetical protein [bacterium endosymbiont of Bathymodiolus sp. 5 South]|jgi:hypothetical protein|uniref:hypothetical protein n=1 Tax=bacterium endosymbiont of Bathymodiolus sp. 5 South TaxID=1181670 RepID=UPI0010BC2154|nr:hypothetical protein [bacterium endosymbiont of Bathymodiolus sp. 5 South]CAC9645208.1 hypothetical protein [uncultured Gammaproteobacteria bacterium]SHN89881.1 hypothetical protein BCLUESOX_2442 [bacterium endosymbiont of Bathymodiolus sp. 5 South]SSC07831.1 hypothetical protein BTURTLESOX_1809 [bacterium endosymbiont of Bathymodiolus sp. 5 South]VVH55513.1 hypothetical protein BSPCLSOX_316 [uncultured Gammaproteobacteria bacterium]VVH62004.1 hypothetical protein BSPWISOX_2670 [uncultured 
MKNKNILAITLVATMGFANAGILEDIGKDIGKDIATVAKVAKGTLKVVKVLSDTEVKYAVEGEQALGKAAVTSVKNFSYGVYEGATSK